MFELVEQIHTKRKLLLCYSFLVCILLSLVSLNAEAQTRQPFGLRRSYSDTRFNRNGTNNHNYHRQSSFSRDDHCKTNYKFDYIQLTLMWAPGSCSTSPHECKREEDKHFTVHGMWPTIKGTEEPSNCCFDNTFYYKAIEPLLPVLNEYWFSYYEINDSRRFWSHEWLKHGTCSRDIPNLRGEALYFGTTVQLAKQMPILEAFKKSDIVPQNGKVYQSSQIVNALTPISQGKVIQIACDYEHHQSVPVLTGLNFCFDANLKPVDCPEMKRKCQRQIIFPASSTRISDLRTVV